ncbi:hypothetical protein NHJ13734_007258 [Beauveria thailandica]
MSHARQASSMPRTRQACEPCRQKGKNQFNLEAGTGHDRGPLQTARTSSNGSIPSPDVCEIFSASPRSASSGLAKLFSALCQMYQNLRSIAAGLMEASWSLQQCLHMNHLVDTSAAGTANLLQKRERLKSGKVMYGLTTSVLTLITSPEPSEAALRHFVTVYRTQLHHQPLALFNTDTVLHEVMAAPRFLLWSFLSLLLNISSHDFYEGSVDTARELYAHLAETAVMKLAADGVPTHELIQALCLISLKHIQSK